MTSAIQAVNYASHSKIKIKSSANYQHAKSQQVVPLIIHEFSRASAEMPIVFVKNGQTGELQSVALLGLTVNENLFYSEDKWLANYLPALITHHPFALLPSQNDESQLQVVIKEDSHLVSNEEGDALFDDKGNETQYMEKRKSALGHYYENSQTTKAFMDLLVEKSLLSEQNLTMKLNDENISINGVYLVDEKALKALPDEDFLILRQRGYLAPIYNHLSSLHQLSRLARLKSEV
ncbi:multidrug transporter [Colwellia sp. 75C3]|uniref:SapC family protein n=1 Tax=Colwellia sp. 75C3 TaxID=888425 RepID=UPI000C324201|nr:SapC family protein [Colwellia sp. 75C3]PKG86272.1 multidrug transporter [Colwellia sp. 75C3]